MYIIYMKDILINRKFTALLGIGAVNCYQVERIKNTNYCDFC